jgi:hypothetical protein
MKDYQATMIASARENISEAQKPKLLLFSEEVDHDLTNLNPANDTGLNRLKKKVSDRLDAWYLEKSMDEGSAAGMKKDDMLA